MSIIKPDTIHAIAHSVDIPKLADEAAKTLAPDVEYRLREVVQEALKFAKHAKRTKLTTGDINDALRLRNVEPLYGFGSRDPAKFLRVATHPELMYVRDPELNYHELIETPLPKLPREAGVAAHWLCINGVQPDLPENTAVEQPPAKRQRLFNFQKQPGVVTQDGMPAAAALAGPDSHAGLAAPGTIPAAGAAAAAAAASTAAATGSRLPQGQAINPRAAAATAAVQLALPLRHAVSRELQVYFDKIVGLLLSAPASAAGPGSSRVGAAGSSSFPAAAAPSFPVGAAAGSSAAAAAAAAGAAAGAGDKQAALLRGAFASVSADPGLHPLVPYFTAFIADGVVQHLGDLVLLGRLLQLARALLANPAVHMEPYLQQLLPAVVTCVVTKSLGCHPLEDHWALRRQAAALLASIAAQFSAPHHNLTPRLCRVLAQAFLDPTKPFTSKYGAVVGLQALGPQVVRTLLIPHLEPFMSASLFPAMGSLPDDNGSSNKDQAGGTNSSSARQQQQQQQQRRDAWQVYSALLSATGAAMYDLLIGQLQGKLPVHLLLARRSKPGGDWETEYTRTLLAAKRPVAVKLAVRKDGQGVDLSLQVAGSAAAAAAAVGGGVAHAANGQIAAAQDASGNGADVVMTDCDSSGKPAHMQLQGPVAAASSRAQQLRRGRAAGAAAAAAAVCGSSSSSQPSVAEVLGQSWKEDSDVNATLGALLHLFGEDLLPCLPLAQVAAVSL